MNSVTREVKIVSESVNHPKHYNFGSIEVIDVLEDWQLGFHEANAVKYIARAKHKGNELEDLRKARWYLDRRIRNLKNPDGVKTTVTWTQKPFEPVEVCAECGFPHGHCRCQGDA